MSEIELLNLVLTATRQKKLNWRQVEERDCYIADVDRYLYIIKYQNPVMADGKQTEGHLIKAVIAGVLITCAERTPQAEVVEQILAAAFPEWAERERFMEEARKEAAARLVALIEGTTEEAQKLFSLPSLPACKRVVE